VNSASSAARDFREADHLRLEQRLALRVVRAVLDREGVQVRVWHRLGEDGQWAAGGGEGCLGFLAITSPFATDLAEQ